LTLTELLIAGVLLSGVFVAAATVYISALRFMNSMRNNRQLDIFMAMEHMTRKINLANQVIVLDAVGAAVADGVAGKELKICMDYRPNLTDPNNAPLGTTAVTTDDRWVKYKFVRSSQSLRWMNVVFASGTDGFDDRSSDEVVNRLQIDEARSTFTRLNSTTVRINLVAQAGNGNTVTLNTDVMAHLMANA